jgi:hypothetical protein
MEKSTQGAMVLSTSRPSRAISSPLPHAVASSAAAARRQSSLVASGSDFNLEGRSAVSKSARQPDKIITFRLISRQADLTERLFFSWTDLKPARPLPAGMGPMPDPFWRNRTTPKMSTMPETDARACTRFED